jgi:hypothetical protein
MMESQKKNKTKKAKKETFPCPSDLFAQSSMGGG